MIFLLLGVSACNVPHLAKQARLDAAAGDLDQAVAHYDAALAQYSWLPQQRREGIEGERASVVDAFLYGELAAAEQDLAAMRWWDGFERIATIQAEAAQRGADPRILTEANRVLAEGVRAYLPTLRSFLLPDSHERLAREALRLEALLPDGDPLRTTLVELRHQAAAWHGEWADGAAAAPGSAYLHHRAALRYGAGDVAAMQAARAALAPEVDLDWQVEVTGWPCAGLGPDLQARFPRSNGAPVRLRLEVTSCDQRTERWTEQVETTRTVKQYTGTSTSTSLHYDEARETLYEVTDVDLGTMEDVTVTEVEAVARRTDVVEFAGRAVLIVDGVERPFPFAGSSRLEARAEFEGNRGVAYAEALAPVVAAIEEAKRPVLQARVDAALAAAAEGTTLRDVEHSHVVAILNAPGSGPDESVRWFQGHYGLDSGTVRAILDGAALAVEPPIPFSWPRPDPQLIALEEQIAVPSAWTDRRAHSLLAAQHVEAAFAWRQSPLDPAVWGASVRGSASTVEDAADDDMPTVLYVEAEAPQFGGQARGYSMGLFTYGGQPGRQVLGIGLAFTHQRVEEQRYNNLALAFELYVPATRWVTIELAVQPNLLWFGTLLWEPRPDRHHYSPLSAGLAVNLSDRLYVRGAATRYFGADPIVTFGAGAGVRL